MWGLGVPEDVGFCDVYGLDDELLAMVPSQSYFSTLR